MRALSVLCLLSVALALPSIANASAGNGELFGYKLGEKYPVDESTLGKSRGLVLDIVAQKPVKPEEIGEVTVITTVKSYTIIEIHSDNRFASRKEAQVFAAKYAGIFVAKYPKAKLDFHSTEARELDAILNDKYHLLVLVYDLENGGAGVQINLSPLTSYNQLVMDEYNSLFLEGADSEGLTKGL